MFRRIHIVLSVVTALSFSMPVPAQTIIQHLGDTNPLIEGFQGGSGSGLAQDMGFAAWQVSAPSVNDLNFYTSGGLSASVKHDALTKGWLLSQTVRISGDRSQLSGATTNIDFGNRRYDMNLFLDVNGDTTVRLDTSVQGGNPITVTGPTYTLVGSGSSYHQFALKYDPVSSTADLIVDGTERISNYGGHTDFVNDSGVLFGAFKQGTGRFNSVSFSVVPAPTALITLLVGAVPGIGVLLRRRRK